MMLPGGLRPEDSSTGRLTALLEFARSCREDLGSAEWQPLRTQPCWRNPNFFTCMLTGGSVQQAVSRGLFPLLGLGPLLVLLSSLTYWHNPLKSTWRRTLDVSTVRLGMTSQVLLALLLCARGRLPVAGPLLLLGGYAAAIPCYAAGRVLTVRGQRLRGAWVHGGLHLFSNLGNVLMLLRFSG